MKSAALSFVFLAAAMTATAQQPSGAAIAGMEQSGQQSAPQTSALMDQLKQRVAELNQRLCPIDMEARQGGGLHILRAQRDGKVTRPPMTPTLTLRDAGRKIIVSANITAQGYGGSTGGAMPLQTGTAERVKPNNNGSDNNGPDDKMIIQGDKRPRITRTLTIQFERDNSDEDSSQFELPGFVTLSSIQLNSVTYTDGTIWNIAAPRSCRVAPSPLMLVGGGN